MKKRLLSILLTLVMVLGTMQLPVLAAEIDSHANQVRVIVENTTYLTADGAPWDGTLVDTWVTLEEESSIMSCIVDALGEYTQEGAESGYISSINGLKEMDGGEMSGWMGTLNDWFTNEGFDQFTVANGGLEAGDEICVMYTCLLGMDLGCDWNNLDNRLQDVTVSTGEIAPAFDIEVTAYTLNVPKETASVVVTPTAANKNYQVRTYVGETQYKRTAQIPVENGTQIVVKSGDPSWPSMNMPEEGQEAAVYTFTVHVEGEEEAKHEIKGTGTEADPYLLSDALDLATLSEDSQTHTYKDAYFLMTADITLPADWTPIGSSAARFAGTIDGDGHLLTIPEGSKTMLGYTLDATLQNLNIYGPKINGNGVLASYTTGATGTCITIENVTLKSGTQTSGSGFVSGYASGSYPCIIRNCTVEKDVVIGDGTASNIGSFGGDFNGTIIGCVSHATVKGVNYVGGICGNKGQTMGDYILQDCIFDGEVIATGDYAGGISGGGYGGTNWGLASAPNTPCATILNCLNAGSVTGADYVGGILGAEPGVKECWNNGVGYIQNNLSIGSIHSEGTHVGGVIGFMSSVNACNVISGNYYLEGCGASKGIGIIDMVETPETSGSFGTGWNKYTLSGATYGRTDDPAGADADKLAKSCTAAELQDGTVLLALNSGVNSSRNWQADGDSITMVAYGEQHLARITCSTLSSSSGVSQQVRGTSVLAGRDLTLIYNDGTTATVATNDPQVSTNYTLTPDMVGTSFPAAVIYDGHELVFLMHVTTTTPVIKDGVEKTLAATAWTQEPFTIDLTQYFEDPDGDPLTYKVKIGSAKYVAAETVDGVYTYTPTAAGSVTLKFTATDGSGTSSAINVTLTISADKELAGNVSAMIAEIGEVSLESEETIKTAREAYDALTEAQQAMVETVDVLSLELAEAKLAVLKQQQELKDAQTELEAAKNELDAAKQELSTKEQELTDKTSELETAKTDLEHAKTELEAAQTELEAAKTELDAAKTELEQYQAMEEYRALKASAVIRAKATSTKNSVTLKWTKVAGADGYHVYYAKGKGSLKKAKTIQNVETLTYTKSKLSKDTYYRFVVKAYKVVNGTAQVLAAAPVIYEATSYKTAGNPVSVTLKSAKTVSLKAGKTSKINATVKNGSLKTKLYTKALRYQSRDTKIAKVSSTGTITAVKKGTTYIDVFAQNGVSKTVKVVVK